MRAAAFHLAAVLVVTAVFADAVVADDAAKAAAETFGGALVSGLAAELRPILPAQGRVHLTLNRLGPEEGLFGARQVEAVFGDFLARGRVESFDLGRCGSDGARSAVARGRAGIVDRDGRGRLIGLHLAFELEGERWVLREVKETAE